MDQKQEAEEDCNDCAEGTTDELSSLLFDGGADEEAQAPLNPAPADAKPAADGKTPANDNDTN